uniref:Uncharacterized protein n=1 Tax=Anguilla anguilla TaxID=7936 RepID=A0A0E9VQC0_ANGAN
MMFQTLILISPKVWHMSQSFLLFLSLIMSLLTFTDTILVLMLTSTSSRLQKPRFKTRYLALYLNQGHT